MVSREMLFLPDELLLAIFRQLPVPDVFQLALTNRRLADIAQRYGKSIAPCAVRNSFPDASLLIRADVATQDFEWLKSLVPRYLATVLIDRFRLRSPHMFHDDYGIPAEDEDGEKLRGAVAQGLCILSRLSVISKEGYKLPENDVPRQPFRERARRFLKYREPRDSRSRALDLLHRRENMIRARRLQYLETLDNQSVQNYRLMFAFLIQPFLTNYDPPTAFLVTCFRSGAREPHGPDSFDWDGDDGKRLYRADSWVNWYIFHEGPLLFWKQWYYCNDKTLIRDRALDAWNTRTSEQISIERESIADMGPIIKPSVPYRDIADLHLVPALQDYRRKKTELLRVNQYKPKEILNDVPYWIGFRNNSERKYWHGFP